MTGRRGGGDRGGAGQRPEDAPVTDAEITRIAGGATVSFGGRALGAAFKYGAQLLIALWLGAGRFGVYAVGFAVYEFAELAARLGLPEGVIRFTAAFRETGDREGEKGTLVRGLQLPFLAGIAVGALLFLGADFLAVRIFEQPRLAGLLKTFAVALPFGATMFVAGYATTVREVSGYQVVVEELLRPGVNLVLLALLLWAGFGIIGTALAWAGACAVAMVAGLRFVKRLFPVVTDRAVGTRYETRSLLSFSLPLALGNASWLLIVWTDIILLGVLASAEQVGIYRAVSQTAFVIPLFLKAINTIFAPMIARQFEARELGRMASTFQMATRWSLLLTLPVFVVMLVVPEDLLHMFGREFEAGALALVVLATGQLVNAASGGVDHMLMMSGRQYQKMAGDVAFGLLNVVLNLLFIPRWGIEGAAFATGISIAGLSLLRAVQVYWSLGAQAYNPSYLKLIVAAVVALAGGVLLADLLAPTQFLVRLVGAGAGVTVLYSAVIWLAGFEREDRLVLARLRERLAC